MAKEPLKPVITDGTSFKVIGLGGVGGPIARNLAVFLAATDVPVRLLFIDGDHFEPNNAYRMLFGSYGNKAEVTADELKPRFEDSQLAITAIPSFITKDNIGNMIQEGDVIMLAVDNHTTRKMVSDHCATLKNITVISGGNDGVEHGKRGTFGNVQAYIRKDGQDVTLSLTAAHPEIANPADKHPEEKSCTELLFSVPQILFTNLTVASAMLNTLLLQLAGQLKYEELVFDTAEGLMRPIQLR